MGTHKGLHDTGCHRSDKVAVRTAVCFSGFRSSIGLAMRIIKLGKRQQNERQEYSRRSLHSCPMAHTLYEQP